MKHKAPLVLMEQVIMILVFALAAALCLQVFALSDRLSRRNEVIDRAVLLCQNTAEALKATGGDLSRAREDAAADLGATRSPEGWYICYGEDWSITCDPSLCAYRLEVQPQPAAVSGLCRAEIRFTDAVTGEALYSLPVAWQEVNGYG